MKKILLIICLLIPNLIFGLTDYTNNFTFGSQDIDDSVSINFSGLGFNGVIRGDSAFSRFRIIEGGTETDLVFKNTQGRVPYAGANGYATATDGLFFDASNTRLGINNNVPGETLDVLGNAKVSNSVQNKITIYEHAAKPAAPNAGYTKNYYKADGKYNALSAGDVETEIAGDAGGAAGEFNYISPNGDAELLTTYGWTCTGNLSMASATTTQLFGAGYFTLTAAANSKDDYCEYDFDLDGGDTAAMLSFIAERIRAGTGFDTEDASVRLYDKDDGKYINNNSTIYASTIGQRHGTGFQTHASNTNYGLRLVSNVDSTFVFDIDNIKLQRSGVQSSVLPDTVDFVNITNNGTTASIVSDSIGYIDSFSGESASYYVAHFKTGIFTVIPSVECLPADSSTVANVRVDGVTTSGFNAQAFSYSGDGAALVNSRCYISKQGVDAERNYAMSSTTLNGEIFSRYTSDAGTQAFTTTAQINFEDKEEDKTNTVTTGAAWHFDVQEDGTYSIKTKIIPYFTDVAVGQSAYLYLFKNGVEKERLWYNTFPSAFTNSYVTMKGSATISLVRGDYIDIRARQITTGTATLPADTAFNSVSIWKTNSGTEKLFKPAKVYVYAYTSVQTVLSNEWKKFIPTVEHTDSHNAFSSGDFVAPRDDHFLFCHNNLLSGITGWGLDEYFTGHVITTSNTFRLSYQKIFTNDGAGTSIGVNVKGCVSVPLLEGETGYIDIYQNSGVTTTLVDGQAYNWITIESE